MDDFLEMERLVALPETLDGSGKSGPESVTGEAVVDSENSLAAETEVSTSLTKELEEKLEKLEEEKSEVENEVKCNREEVFVHVENSLAAEIEVLTYPIKQLEEQLEKLEAEKDELESEVKCNREEAVIQIKNSLAAEIEVLTCRIKQLEVKLEKLEAEKDELKREVKCDREVESTLRLELEAIACDKMEQDEVLEDRAAKRSTVAFVNYPNDHILFRHDWFCYVKAPDGVWTSFLTQVIGVREDNNLTQGNHRNTDLSDNEFLFSRSPNLRHCFLFCCLAKSLPARR
ncbi:unnamed protein product [Arabidopsis halleri]